LSPDQFGGYLARKQTHIHKLAMIFAVSESDELIIHQHHLERASDMVDALEDDMPYVFDKIGRTQSTRALNDLVEIVAAYSPIPQQDLYRRMSRQCTFKEFADILQSAVSAGFIEVISRGTETLIKAKRA
jgi:hypothetical protein